MAKQIGSHPALLTSSSLSVSGSRREKIIVLSAFAAMGMVGEVLWSGFGPERLPNSIDDFLICSHVLGGLTLGITRRDDRAYGPVPRMRVALFAVGSNELFDAALIFRESVGV